MKILIVDDSRTVRAAICALLGRMQHTVLEASEGEEALRLYAEHKPDLLMIDAAMPGMDGYEVAKRIRADHAEEWAPIIFLSAGDADQDLDRAVEAGGDDYLMKPVTYAVLNAK